MKETETNDWRELFDVRDKDQLIEVLHEMDWEFNDYKTVSEMDILMEQLSKESYEDLRKSLIRALGETGSEVTDDQIYDALNKRYPNGCITSDNSDYQQWGGVPDEEEDQDD